MPQEALGEGLATRDVVSEDPAALLTAPTPQAPHAAGGGGARLARCMPGVVVSSARSWAGIRFRRLLGAAAVRAVPPFAHAPAPLNDASRWALSRCASAIGGGSAAARGLASAAGAGQRTHLRGGAAARGVVTRCRLRCQS